MNSEITTVASKFVRLLSLLMLSALLPPATLAATGDYVYTAQTYNTVAVSNRVVALGIEWNCQSTKCTTKGPWPKPGVPACKALAEQVGKIRTYGHSGASLNAAQLVECNGSAAVTKAKKPTKKVLTPGGVSDSGSVETLPDTPTLVLENPYSDIIYACTTRWRCVGTRCTLFPGMEDRLVGREAVHTCSAVAQQAGRIMFMTDGRRPFSAELLAKCNSPVVHQMEIIACSGADDLRSASKFDMGIKTEGRNLVLGQFKTIFTDIPANTCKTIRIGGPLWFNPFILGQLSYLEFRFRTYDSTIMQTEDNWDMTQFTVNATVTDPGGRRYMQRIVDRQGNPLVKRFSSSTPWRININP
jgi:hypothetical protein